MTAPALALEALLTSPNGFGLQGASPLQRAICRGTAGQMIADLLPLEERMRFFGCEELAGIVPTLVVVIAGVRSGKSLMAAAAALLSALTADLSQLMPHERARVAIVAPTTDNAAATFRLLVGAIESAPHLRALLAEPTTADTVVVVRDDGRTVEIVVVAAHRGGTTLRSRWLAGFVLEETALFGTDTQGYAISAEELLRAAEARLVKGAQGWIISSPFGPQGLLYGLWKEHFGKPDRVLVVKAPTPAMNPAFDLAQIEAIRRRDPDAASREYDAEWTDSVTVLLSSLHLSAAARKAPADVGPEPFHFYEAAMDPGTRGNAWTLAVATSKRDEAGKLRAVIVLVRQWVGSKTSPLSPDAVLKEIAGILAPYGVKSIKTDQYSSDALRDIGRRYGLHVYDLPVTAAGKIEMYETLRNKLADGAVELPDDPVVRADLMGVRKVVRANGFSIELTKTPDGRHCDFAPPIATLVAQHLREPSVPKVGPAPGSPEWYAAELAREKLEASKRTAQWQRRQSRRMLRNPMALLEGLRR